MSLDVAGSRPGRMERDSTVTVAFTLVWVVGVGLVGIPYLVASRTPDRVSGRGGRLRLLGIPLVVAGAVLYLWSTRALTGGGGTPVPTAEPAALATHGPYRYTRNPFYVSVLCVVAGEAVLLGNLGLVAYLGVLWGYVELLVVGYEEPRLTEKYGVAYDEYRRSVPRWIAPPGPA